MAEKDGGRAFPTVTVDGYVHEIGMSLRDWFAGQVIGQLMIMERRQPEHDFTTVEARQRWYAAESYRIADYMLEERAK